MSRAWLVYIIGAITGNPDFKEQFDRAEKAIKESLVCDVINPAKRQFPAVVQSDYAHLSYNAVKAADAIAVLWNIENSFGATMEYLIAKDMGKTIFMINKDFQIYDLDGITRKDVK